MHRIVIMRGVAEIKPVMVSLEQFYVFIQREAVFLMAAVCEKDLLCVLKEGRFPFGTGSLKDFVRLRVNQPV